VTNVLTISEASQKIAERVDPQRAGAVAVSQQRGNLSFQDMGQVMEFAKLMAISDVAVPKHLRNNPGACLAVTIQALDWQLHPFQVANKSYSVNDRLAFESQLVQAVILARAPIKGRFAVEYSGAGPTRVCKITATLKDETGTVDYTSPPFQAIKVKNSPLWTADPGQQLFYYSARALCRRHFPDVLLGIYTPDELPTDPNGPKDVTPKSSLADRFAKPADPAAGGFSVHHVDAETRDNATPSEEQTEAEASDDTAPEDDAAEPTDAEVVAEPIKPPPFPGPDAASEELQAWCTALMAIATTQAEVDRLWENRIASRSDDIFPGDMETLAEIRDARRQELA
jgi:hypothetical protein